MAAMPITAAGATEEAHRLLGHPRPTIRDYIARLRRDAALMGPGRQGPNAPALSTSEAVNLLIALACGQSHFRANPDPVVTVRKVRSGKFAASRSIVPDEMLSGLALAKAETCGQALDAILGDMRSGTWARVVGGRYDTVGNPPPLAALNIVFTNYQVRISLHTSKGQALLLYDLKFTDEEIVSYLQVQRILDGVALEKLADAMGPIEDVRAAV